MKVLGITGGVGAGKSTVLGYMRERYGADVIETDRVGRELQRKGTDCFEQIVRLFGPSCVGPDGELDRPWIAQAVFSDPDKLSALDQIMHPAVMRQVKLELEKDREAGCVPFAVIESAILIEAGYRELCDEIWFVSVSPEERVRRLKAQRGYSDEKIASVLSRQKSDAEFAVQCDYRIDNSVPGTGQIRRQIDEALRARGFVSQTGFGLAEN